MARHPRSDRRLCRAAPDTTQVDQLTFRAGPVLIRLIVTAAGPAANLVVAATLYAGLAEATGEISFLPVARSIEPGSPAQMVGFQPGDRITAADGKPVVRFEDVRPILESHPNLAVRFDDMRNREALALTTTLRQLSAIRRGVEDMWRAARWRARAGAVPCGRRRRL